MLGLLLGAVVLGIIIAVMEDGDFPGFGSLLLCVIATVGPAVLLNRYVFPPSLSILGFVVGAICAGFAISALCDMTVKRATIAASIYLGIQIVLGLLIALVT